MTHAQRTRRQTGTSGGGVLARTLAAISLLLIFAGTVQAQSLSLGWNANTESDLSGYVIYYGTTTGVYPSNVSVGKVTTYTLSGLTPGQTYYLALKAVNTGGQQSSYSSQISATVSGSLPLPSTPASPSPASAATSVSLGTSLTWSSTGATSYTVKFGTTNPPSQVATGLTNATYTPSGLVSGKKYYWQIIAVNSVGSTTGSIWTFTTATSAPGAPATIAPTNNATGINTSSALTWSSTSATSYTMKFGTTNPPPQVATNLSTASYTPSNMAGLTKYYWQVVATNIAGSTTGAVWSFTTAAAQSGVPGTPTSASPANSGTGVSLNATLTWTSSGATSYAVKFGLVNPPPQVTTGVSSPSYAATGLAKSTTYYWQIVATNASGSTNGPVWSFRTGPVIGTRTGDFDNDGKVDPTFYRPTQGYWYTLRSSSNYTIYQLANWGIPTDVPVPGDYDGDGLTDYAQWRPSTGVWWFLLSGTNYTQYETHTWGQAGDVPVPGDYDGDGTTDIAVWRPSTGTWMLLLSSTDFSASASFKWGVPGDVAATGDYDGDGSTDIAIWRPSTGTWWILLSSTDFSTYQTYQWGLPGDTPVAGDYDGDGKTDLAIYRPSTNTWMVELSASGYATTLTYQWGNAGDITVPADYDGDGKTDIAVYRPSTGMWYLRQSSTNYATLVTAQWGSAGDVPIVQQR